MQLSWANAGESPPMFSIYFQFDTSFTDEDNEVHLIMTLPFSTSLEGTWSVFEDQCETFPSNPDGAIEQSGWADNAHLKPRVILRGSFYEKDVMYRMDFRPSFWPSTASDASGSIELQFLNSFQEEGSIVYGSDSASLFLSVFDPITENLIEATTAIYSSGEGSGSVEFEFGDEFLVLIGVKLREKSSKRILLVAENDYEFTDPDGCILSKSYEPIYASPLDASCQNRVIASEMEIRFDDFSSSFEAGEWFYLLTSLKAQSWKTLKVSVLAMEEATSAIQEKGVFSSSTEIKEREWDSGYPKIFFSFGLDPSDESLPDNLGLYTFDGVSMAFNSLKFKFKRSSSHDSGTQELQINLGSSQITVPLAFIETNLHYNGSPYISGMLLVIPDCEITSSMVYYFNVKVAYKKEGSLDSEFGSVTLYVDGKIEASGLPSMRRSFSYVMQNKLADIPMKVGNYSKEEGYTPTQSGFSCLNEACSPQDSLEEALNQSWLENKLTIGDDQIFVLRNLLGNNSLFYPDYSSRIQANSTVLELIMNPSIKETMRTNKEVTEMCEIVMTRFSLLDSSLSDFPPCYFDSSTFECVEPEQCSVASNHVGYAMSCVTEKFVDEYSRFGICLNYTFPGEDQEILCSDQLTCGFTNDEDFNCRAFDPHDFTECSMIKSLEGGSDYWCVSNTMNTTNLNCYEAVSDSNGKYYCVDLRQDWPEPAEQCYFDSRFNCQGGDCVAVDPMDSKHWYCIETSDDPADYQCLEYEYDDAWENGYCKDLSLFQCHWDDYGNCMAEMCQFKVLMYDDGGDGWNGAILRIYINFQVVYTETVVSSRRLNEVHVKTNHGDFLHFVYTPNGTSSSENENWFRIYDNRNILIFESENEPSQGLKFAYECDGVNRSECKKENIRVSGSTVAICSPIIRPEWTTASCSDWDSQNFCEDQVLYYIPDPKPDEQCGFNSDGSCEPSILDCQTSTNTVSYPSYHHLCLAPNRIYSDGKTDCMEYDYFSDGYCSQIRRCFYNSDFKCVTDQCMYRLYMNSTAFDAWGNTDYLEIIANGYTIGEYAKTNGLNFEEEFFFIKDTETIKFIYHGSNADNQNTFSISRDGLEFLWFNEDPSDNEAKSFECDVSTQQLCEDVEVNSNYHVCFASQAIWTNPDCDDADYVLSEGEYYCADPVYVPYPKRPLYSRCLTTTDGCNFGNSDCSDFSYEEDFHICHDEDYPDSIYQCNDYAYWLGSDSRIGCLEKNSCYFNSTLDNQCVNAECEISVELSSSNSNVGWSNSFVEIYVNGYLKETATVDKGQASYTAAFEIHENDRFLVLYWENEAGENNKYNSFKVNSFSTTKYSSGTDPDDLESYSFECHGSDSRCEKFLLPGGSSNQYICASLTSDWVTFECLSDSFVLSSGDYLCERTLVNPLPDPEPQCWYNSSGTCTGSASCTDTTISYPLDSYTRKYCLSASQDPADFDCFDWQSDGDGGYICSQLGLACQYDDSYQQCKGVNSDYCSYTLVLEDLVDESWLSTQYVNVKINGFTIGNFTVTEEVLRQTFFLRASTRDRIEVTYYGSTIGTNKASLITGGTTLITKTGAGLRTFYYFSECSEAVVSDSCTEVDISLKSDGLYMCANQPLSEFGNTEGKCDSYLTVESDSLCENGENYIIQKTYAPACWPYNTGSSIVCSDSEHCEFEKVDSDGSLQACRRIWYHDDIDIQCYEDYRLYSDWLSPNGACHTYTACNYGYDADGDYGCVDYSCHLEIVMSDSAGDGWGTGRFEIETNGFVMDTVRLQSGSKTGSWSNTLMFRDKIKITYTGGSVASNLQNAYKIFFNENEEANVSSVVKGTEYEFTCGKTISESSLCSSLSLSSGETADMACMPVRADYDGYNVHCLSWEEESGVKYCTDLDIEPEYPEYSCAFDADNECPGSCFLSDITPSDDFSTHFECYPSDASWDDFQCLSFSYSDDTTGYCQDPVSCSFDGSTCSTQTCLYKVFYEDIFPGDDWDDAYVQVYINYMEIKKVRAFGKSSGFEYFNVPHGSLFQAEYISGFSDSENGWGVEVYGEQIYYVSKNPPNGIQVSDSCDGTSFCTFSDLNPPNDYLACRPSAWTPTMEDVCDPSEGSNEECPSYTLIPKDQPRQTGCSFSYSSCTPNGSDECTEKDPANSDPIPSKICTPFNDFQSYQCDRFKIFSDSWDSAFCVDEIKCGYDENFNCGLLVGTVNIKIEDTSDDGWEGAWLGVRVNGYKISESRMKLESPEQSLTTTITLNDQDFLEIRYHSGDHDAENTVKISFNGESYETLSLKEGSIYKRVYNHRFFTESCLEEELWTEHYACAPQSFFSNFVEFECSEFGFSDMSIPQHLCTELFSKVLDVPSPQCYFTSGLICSDASPLSSCSEQTGASGEKYCLEDGAKLSDFQCDRFVFDSAWSAAYCLSTSGCAFTSEGSCSSQQCRYTIEAKGLGFDGWGSGVKLKVSINDYPVEFLTVSDSFLSKSYLLSNEDLLNLEFIDAGNGGGDSDIEFSVILDGRTTLSETTAPQNGDEFIFTCEVSSQSLCEEVIQSGVTYCLPSTWENQYSGVSCMGSSPCSNENMVLSPKSANIPVTFCSYNKETNSCESSEPLQTCEMAEYNGDSSFKICIPADYNDESNYQCKEFDFSQFSDSGFATCKKTLRCNYNSDSSLCFGSYCDYKVELLDSDASGAWQGGTILVFINGHMSSNTLDSIEAGAKYRLQEGDTIEFYYSGSGMSTDGDGLRYKINEEEWTYLPSPLGFGVFFEDICNEGDISAISDCSELALANGFSDVCAPATTDYFDIECNWFQNIDKCHNSDMEWVPKEPLPACNFIEGSCKDASYLKSDTSCATISSDDLNICVPKDYDSLAKWQCVNYEFEDDWSSGYCNRLFACELLDSSCTTNLCTYKLTLENSDGDGWDSSQFIRVFLNGFSYARWTLDSGFSTAYQLFLKNDDILELSYYSGDSDQSNFASLEGASTTIQWSGSGASGSFNDLKSMQKYSVTCDTAGGSWCGTSDLNGLTTCRAKDTEFSTTETCLSSSDGECLILYFEQKQTPRVSCSFSDHQCSPDAFCALVEFSDRSGYCVPSDDTESYQCLEFKIYSDISGSECQTAVKCGYDSSFICGLEVGTAQLSFENSGSWDGSTFQVFVNSYLVQETTSSDGDSSQMITVTLDDQDYLEVFFNKGSSGTGLSLSVLINGVLDDSVSSPGYGFIYSYLYETGSHVSDCQETEVKPNHFVCEPASIDLDYVRRFCDEYTLEGGSAYCSKYTTTIPSQPRDPCMYFESSSDRPLGWNMQCQSNARNWGSCTEKTNEEGASFCLSSGDIVSDFSCTELRYNSDWSTAYCTKHEECSGDGTTCSTETCQVTIETFDTSDLDGWCSGCFLQILINSFNAGRIRPIDSYQAKTFYLKKNEVMEIRFTGSKFDDVKYSVTIDGSTTSYNPSSNGETTVLSCLSPSSCYSQSVDGIAFCLPRDFDFYSSVSCSGDSPCSIEQTNLTPKGLHQPICSFSEATASCETEEDNFECHFSDYNSNPTQKICVPKGVKPNIQANYQCSNFLTSSFSDSGFIVCEESLLCAFSASSSDSCGSLFCDFEIHTIDKGSPGWQGGRVLLYVNGRPLSTQISSASSSSSVRLNDLDVLELVYLAESSIAFSDDMITVQENDDTNIFSEYLRPGWSAQFVCVQGAAPTNKCVNYNYSTGEFACVPFENASNNLAQITCTESVAEGLCEASDTSIEFDYGNHFDQCYFNSDFGCSGGGSCGEWSLEEPLWSDGSRVLHYCVPGSISGKDAQCIQPEWEGTSDGYCQMSGHCYFSEGGCVSRTCPLRVDLENKSDGFWGEDIYLHFYINDIWQKKLRLESNALISSFVLLSDGEVLSLKMKTGLESATEYDKVRVYAGENEVSSFDGESMGASGWTWEYVCDVARGVYCSEATKKGVKICEPVSITDPNQSIECKTDDGTYCTNTVSSYSKEPKVVCSYDAIGESCDLTKCSSVEIGGITYCVYSDYSATSDIQCSQLSDSNKCQEPHICQGNNLECAEDSWKGYCRYKLSGGSSNSGYFEAKVNGISKELLTFDGYSAYGLTLRKGERLSIETTHAHGSDHVEIQDSFGNTLGSLNGNSDAFYSICSPENVCAFFSDHAQLNGFSDTTRSVYGYCYPSANALDDGVSSRCFEYEFNPISDGINGDVQYYFCADPAQSYISRRRRRAIEINPEETLENNEEGSPSEQIDQLEREKSIPEPGETKEPMRRLEDNQQNDFSFIDGCLVSTTEDFSSMRFKIKDAYAWDQLFSGEDYVLFTDYRVKYNNGKSHAFIWKHVDISLDSFPQIGNEEYDLNLFDAFIQMSFDTDQIEGQIKEAPITFFQNFHFETKKDEDSQYSIAPRLVFDILVENSKGDFNLPETWNAFLVIDFEKFALGDNVRRIQVFFGVLEALDTEEMGCGADFDLIESCETLSSGIGFEKLSNEIGEYFSGDQVLSADFLSSSIVNIEFKRSPNDQDGFIISFPVRLNQNQFGVLYDFYEKAYDFDPKITIAAYDSIGSVVAIYRPGTFIDSQEALNFQERSSSAAYLSKGEVQSLMGLTDSFSVANGAWVDFDSNAGTVSLKYVCHDCDTEKSAVGLCAPWNFMSNQEEFLVPSNCIKNTKGTPQSSSNLLYCLICQDLSTDGDSLSLEAFEFSPNYSQWPESLLVILDTKSTGLVSPVVVVTGDKIGQVIRKNGLVVATSQKTLPLGSPVVSLQIAMEIENAVPSSGSFKFTLTESSDPQTQLIVSVDSDELQCSLLFEGEYTKCSISVSGSSFTVFDWGELDFPSGANLNLVIVGFETHDNGENYIEDSLIVSTHFEEQASSNNKIDETSDEAPLVIAFQNTNRAIAISSAVLQTTMINMTSEIKIEVMTSWFSIFPGHVFNFKIIGASETSGISVEDMSCFAEDGSGEVITLFSSCLVDSLSSVTLEFMGDPWLSIYLQDFSLVIRGFRNDFVLRNAEMAVSLEYFEREDLSSAYYSLPSLSSVQKFSHSTQFSVLNELPSLGSFIFLEITILDEVESSGLGFLVVSFTLDVLDGLSYGELACFVNGERTTCWNDDDYPKYLFIAVEMEEIIQIEVVGVQVPSNGINGLDTAFIETSYTEREMNVLSFDSADKVEGTSSTFSPYFVSISEYASTSMEIRQNTTIEFDFGVFSGSESKLERVKTLLIEFGDLRNMELTRSTPTLEIRDESGQNIAGNAQIRGSFIEIALSGAITLKKDYKVILNDIPNPDFAFCDAHYPKIYGWNSENETVIMNREGAIIGQKYTSDSSSTISFMDRRQSIPTIFVGKGQYEEFRLVFSSELEHDIFIEATSMMGKVIIEGNPEALTGSKYLDFYIGALANAPTLVDILFLTPQTSSSDPAFRFNLVDYNYIPFIRAKIMEKELVLESSRESITVYSGFGSLPITLSIQNPITADLEIIPVYYQFENNDTIYNQRSLELSNSPLVFEKYTGGTPELELVFRFIDKDSELKSGVSYFVEFETDSNQMDLLSPRLQIAIVSYDYSKEYEVSLESTVWSKNGVLFQISTNKPSLVLVFAVPNHLRDNSMVSFDSIYDYCDVRSSEEQLDSACSIIYVEVNEETVTEVSLNGLLMSNTLYQIDIFSKEFVAKNEPVHIEVSGMTEMSLRDGLLSVLEFSRAIEVADFYKMICIAESVLALNHGSAFSLNYLVSCTDKGEKISNRYSLEEKRVLAADSSEEITVTSVSMVIFTSDSNDQELNETSRVISAFEENSFTKSLNEALVGFPDIISISEPVSITFEPVDFDSLPSIDVLEDTVSLYGFSLNSTGFIYIVVTAVGDLPPSIEQLYAGSDGSGESALGSASIRASDSNSFYEVQFNSSEWEETEHVLYFVAKNRDPRETGFHGDLLITKFTLGRIQIGPEDWASILRETPWVWIIIGVILLFVIACILICCLVCLRIRKKKRILLKVKPQDKDPNSSKSPVNAHHDDSMESSPLSPEKNLDHNFENNQTQIDVNEDIHSDKNIIVRRGDNIRSTNVIPTIEDENEAWQKELISSGSGFSLADKELGEKSHKHNGNENGGILSNWTNNFVMIKGQRNSPGKKEERINQNDTSIRMKSGSSAEKNKGSYEALTGDDNNNFRVASKDKGQLSQGQPSRGLLSFDEINTERMPFHWDDGANLPMNNFLMTKGSKTTLGPLSENGSYGINENENDEKNFKRNLDEAQDPRNKFVMGQGEKGELIKSSQAKEKMNFKTNLLGGPGGSNDFVFRKGEKGELVNQGKEEEEEENSFSWGAAKQPESSNQFKMTKGEKGKLVNQGNKEGNKKDSFSWGEAKQPESSNQFKMAKGEKGKLLRKEKEEEEKSFSWGGAKLPEPSQQFKMTKGEKGELKKQKESKKMKESKKNPFLSNQEKSNFLITKGEKPQLDKPFEDENRERRDFIALGARFNDFSQIRRPNVFEGLEGDPNTNYEITRAEKLVREESSSGSGSPESMKVESLSPESHKFKVEKEERKEELRVFDEVQGNFEPQREFVITRAEKGQLKSSIPIGHPGDYESSQRSPESMRVESLSPENISRFSDARQEREVINYEDQDSAVFNPKPRNKKK